VQLRSSYFLIHFSDLHRILFKSGRQPLAAFFPKEFSENRENVPTNRKKEIVAIKKNSVCTPCLSKSVENLNCFWFCAATKFSSQYHIKGSVVAGKPSPHPDLSNHTTFSPFEPLFFYVPYLTEEF
jgi:hypothetical protein